MEYQFNPTTGKMEAIKGRKAKNAEKVSLDADLMQDLTAFAKEDGMSFQGISYLTEKDASGKTKKDKDGKPVYQLDKDGNKKTVAVETSKAKVNAAVSKYVNAVVAIYVANRKKK